MTDFDNCTCAELRARQSSPSNTRCPACCLASWKPAIQAHEAAQHEERR